MLAHVTRSTARLLAATRARGAGARVAVRLLSTEAPEAPAAAAESKPKKPRQPRTPKKSLLFSDEAEGAAAEGVAAEGVAAEGVAAEGVAAEGVADKREKAAPRQKKKTFSFASAQKEPAPELEVFDYPAYWSEDFPEGFDDAMKHEVEKLEIFSDFAALLDDSWEKEVHPQFDGAAVKLSFNCPLEDFDERLFVDDKTTYDTKVTMEVPLSCFKGLDQAALDVVKQLAGPRYNANKKHIKLTEDRYPTRVFNHKRLCDILHDLTATALEVSAKAKTTA